MIDDKLFDDKHISDILKEFYKNNNQDSKLAEQIIESLKLTDANAFKGMFGADDHAKLLNVLLTAKQKCTHNYKDMLDVAAKLQQNAFSSDENNLNDLRKYMNDTEEYEANEKSLEDLDKANESHTAIDEELDDMIENIIKKEINKEV
jgi:hypothetical protein